MEYVYIGSSDENADWIKTGKGHQTELAVFDLVAEMLSPKGDQGPQSEAKSPKPPNAR